MRRIGSAAAALGVASILVSVLALAARAWWIAELATHFRLQILAVQAVLIALLLACRYHRITLGVAAAAAVNGWHVYPVVWRDSPAAAASGSELTVMTVNVAARNDDADALLATIARERPDLVLVVELSRRWSRDLAPLSEAYAYRKLVPEEGPFGLALLSRFPIEAVSTRKLGPAPLLDGRIAGPGGAFRVLGVHLMPPVSARLAAERNRQLTRLAELRAGIEGPLIVLGDFNISPYSPYYADWVEATGLVDTLAGRGPSATWPAFMPVLGIPIDHCLVSAHFAVLGRRHLPEFGSDHYPVLVNLLQESTR